MSKAILLLLANNHDKRYTCGTLSDGEGIFKLRQKQITNDLTLVFSSVGYEMAERKIQKNEYSDDLKVQLVVLKMQCRGSSL